MPTLPDDIVNPWKGKVRKRTSLTCYVPACDFYDEFSTVAEARREGWRKIGHQWHCPHCVKEANPENGDE